MNNPELEELPLAHAILHHLDLMSQEARCKPWTPPTHFRMLTAMDGAFSKLGKYVPHLDCRIKLTESVAWKEALKAWDKASLEHQPQNQTAAVAEEIATAVNLQSNQEVQAFLILLWLLVARKGDIAKLHANSVTLHPDGRPVAFIEEGKGVKVRMGKYRVVSHCPPTSPWFNILKNFLNAPKKGNYLFRKSLGQSGEVLSALRLANPVLSIRSTRRGAAQALAKDLKVSTETIMNMTGHLRESTLHRYLNWGEHNEKNHVARQEAAKRNLAPPTVTNNTNTNNININNNNFPWLQAQA